MSVNFSEERYLTLEWLAPGRNILHCDVSILRSQYTYLFAGVRSGGYEGHKILDATSEEQRRRQEVT